MKTIIILTLIGFVIGAVIGKITSWYVDSKYYGVDAKAEVNEYMESKYGENWLENL